MRRLTALISTAAIVVSTLGVFAQARPDFSGKWTLDASSLPDGGGGQGRGGRGGGTWGQNPTITQTASTLAVEYTFGQSGNATKLVYNLDGSPSKNMMMGRGGQTETESTATWSGNSLVIITKTGMGEQRRTLSLKGSDLVIEYNSGREGASPVTLVYKKG